MFLHSYAQDQKINVGLYSCVDADFEKYICEQYKEYKAVICFIDVYEDFNDSKWVVVLNYYDTTTYDYEEMLSWLTNGPAYGKLDIPGYDFYLFPKKHDSIFKKKKQKGRIQINYPPSPNYDSYYILDEGYMDAFLFFDNSLYKINPHSRSLTPLNELK